MGVACPVPNSIACDRVGLAVRLRRPARAVVAAIGDRRFKLDDPEWSGRLEPGGRRGFAGFLRRAGLGAPGEPLAVNPRRSDGRWLGSRPVVADVRLLIDRGARRRETVEIRVGLGAGWG